MKLSKLVDQGFIQTLHHLNQQAVPAKLAYKIGKIVAKAAEEQKEYFRLREEVLKKFAEQNDDGTPKTEERNGQMVYITGENTKAALEEINELGDQEIELQKIALNDLMKADVKLSGAQLNDLSEIISE